MGILSRKMAMQSNAKPDKSIMQPTKTLPRAMSRDATAQFASNKQNIKYFNHLRPLLGNKYEQYYTRHRRDGYNDSRANEEIPFRVGSQQHQNRDLNKQLYINQPPSNQIQHGVGGINGLQPAIFSP